jgi:RNA polymerase sigma factor (sigma-70 family)
MPSSGAPPSPSIVRLVERLARADGPRSPSLVEDLDRAFGAHEDDVRRIVRLRARRASEAEVDDLVQDVLLTAWRQLHTWRPESGAFRSWLFGISRNVCNNHGRKLRDELSADGDVDAEDGVWSVLRTLQHAEREQVVLEAAAESLDQLEQDVAYGRWVEELDRDTLAEQVGLADANEVRVVLIRCKRKLEKALRARVEALGHGTSFFRPTSS